MEGKELGLQKGWEIGQEVGFYAGCVQVCNLLACSIDFAEPATLLCKTKLTGWLQEKQCADVMLATYTERCAIHIASVGRCGASCSRKTQLLSHRELTRVWPHWKT